MPKVLLADDSATVQRVVELSFSGKGIDVVSVPDGEQAVARLALERPDVVLADVVMPRMNGYEVAAFIKGDPGLSHIPVLLLAGAFEPVDQARADRIGCDGVLVKPFEPHQVVARVRELVAAARPAARAGAAAPPLSAPAGPPPAGGDRLGPALDDIVFFESELTSPPAASGAERLDRYLERLEAGGPSPAAAGPLPVDDDPDADLPVPTLRQVLDNLPPQSPAAVPQADPAPAVRPAAPAALADVFAELLAAEDGQHGAAPVRLATPAPQPDVTDAMVDEVTRRVLERLAPDAVRALVAPIVSEIAERQVRDEIARIRQAAGR